MGHGEQRHRARKLHSESSDGSMPPLDARREVHEDAADSSEEEAMPPLHYPMCQDPPHAEGEHHDSSDSDDSMPPLQSQERAMESEAEDPPDGAEQMQRAASSDGSMPPLQARQHGYEDDSSDEENMPPLHSLAPENPVKEAVLTNQDTDQSSDDSMPPLQGQDAERESEDEDAQEPLVAVERGDSSDGSMPPLHAQQEEDEGDITDKEAAPPLYHLHVSAARGRHEGPREQDPDAPPGLETSKPSEQRWSAPDPSETAKTGSEGEEGEDGGEADGSASESGDSLPPLEFISKPEPEASGFSHGDFVQLVGLKTPGLNGQQGYIVGLPEGHKEKRLEIKMVLGGKTLSVKISNVQQCEPKEAPRPKHRCLQKGDEVIVRGLTKSVEFNGQRALVIEAQEPDRVTVELRSGQQLSLRRDKLQIVSESDSDREAGDGCEVEAMPALKTVRQLKPKPNEDEPCKFRVGQKVYLHLKNKPEFHGQPVFVLPSDPLRVDASMATVQLPTGKRIITKATHLRPEPPQGDGRRAGRGRLAARAPPQDRKVVQY